LLHDGGSQAVIVSADLLYVGADLRRAILRKLGAGYDPASVLLAASHTHYAPMTQSGMPVLGVVSKAYVDFVASAIAGLVLSLAQHLKPVSITYSEGVTNHAINRRLIRWRVWRDGITHSSKMGPNPGEPRDETIRILRFTGEDQTDCAVLWNYACHPTAYPHALHVTAEFPGVVRRVLRAAVGTDVPVLFLQGFAADVRPPFFNRGSDPISVVRRIAVGPTFAPPRDDEWTKWAESLADEVRKVFLPSPVATVGGPLRSSTTQVFLKDFVDGGDPGQAMTVQSLSIGGKFRFVAMESEPVTKYRKLVESIFPGERLITMGYIDQTFGYLPVDSMIPEGGYEVTDFRHAFAFKGSFRGGIETSVADALSKLKAVTA
jgi:hypothetical protein